LTNTERVSPWTDQSEACRQLVANRRCPAVMANSRLRNDSQVLE
jgi:hypothetical protein